MKLIFFWLLDFRPNAPCVAGCYSGVKQIFAKNAAGRHWNSPLCREKSTRIEKQSCNFLTGSPLSGTIIRTSEVLS